MPLVGWHAVTPASDEGEEESSGRRGLDFCQPYPRAAHRWRSDAKA
jgi:hypothetical protein